MTGPRLAAADDDDADDDAAHRRAALRQGVSVGAATAVYGVSLGALAVASGLSVPQACATSLLLFSGGSQFALVGVLGGGGSVGAAVAASSLLGVRNGLYGVQVAPLLGVRGLRRLAAAQLTIDESTAVAVAQPTRSAARVGFWTTGLAVFVGWNLMTLLGALAGDHLGDPRRYGLDAAASAAFLALLWPRLRQRQAVAVAAAAALVAAALVPVVPVGLPVLAAAGVAAVWGLGGQVTTWVAVLAASAVAFGLKLCGYLVPARWMARPALARASALLPAALLAALVVVQGFSTGTHLVVDARAVGLLVAVVALVLRAPFLLVVVLAAASAAGVRAAGWG